MIGHVAQSKGKMMRYVIWSLLLIWLTSCTGLVHKEPIALEITTESLLAPARTLITEQAAIETAVMMASQTQPEISGARVLPHNIQAKQTTLMAALQSIGGSFEPGTTHDPSMLVWIVTMEGEWTNEFPRPADIAPPPPYTRYIVILDARTGRSIMTAARA
jgi:hypothetical protein